MYYGNVVGVLKEDNDEQRTSILADLLGKLSFAVQRCRRSVRLDSMAAIRHEPGCPPLRRPRSKATRPSSATASFPDTLSTSITRSSRERFAGAALRHS